MEFIPHHQPSSAGEQPYLPLILIGMRSGKIGVIYSHLQPENTWIKRYKEQKSRFREHLLNKTTCCPQPLIRQLVLVCKSEQPTADEHAGSCLTPGMAWAQRAHKTNQSSDRADKRQLDTCKDRRIQLLQVVLDFSHLTPHFPSP